MKEINIKLFGNDYLLIGDIQNGGPIATRSQYENFECSYAHLYPNGDINRFGQVIGTRADIIIVGETEVEPHFNGLNVFEALFEPESWAKKNEQN